MRTSRARCFGQSCPVLLECHQPSRAVCRPQRRPCVAVRPLQTALLSAVFGHAPVPVTPAVSPYPALTKGCILLPARAATRARECAGLWGQCQQGHQVVPGRTCHGCLSLTNMRPSGRNDISAGRLLLSPNLHAVCKQLACHRAWLRSRAVISATCSGPHQWFPCFTLTGGLGTPRLWVY